MLDYNSRYFKESRPNFKPQSLTSSIATMAKTTLRSSLSSLSVLIPFTFIRTYLGLTRKNPTLPNSQTPHQNELRQEQLRINQSLYTYASPPTIPDIAFIRGPVDALPNEMPSRMWILRAALAAARVQLNFANNRVCDYFCAILLFFRALFINRSRDDSIDTQLKRYSSASHNNPSHSQTDLMKNFKDANQQGSLFEEKSKILAPYRSLWSVLPVPTIADVFLQDDVFSRMRVAGFNPMSLFRVRETLPFPISDAQLPDENDSVAAAIAQNRLYAVDYTFCTDLAQNDDKLAVVTKGMFIIPPGGGKLKSVAIEVANQIILPPKASSCPHDTRWACAKLALTTCDAVHHELIAHLGRTHLLVEPFVAATMRQLSPDHPLHVLLRPHFEGTVFINDRASRALVAPGGEIDRIFAGDIASVMRWCSRQVVDNKFNSSMPFEEMDRRGLMDRILQMPYRDDALMHFTAMNEWVYDYLSHYYTSNDAVKSDPELRQWAAELVDPNRGRVKEFGDDGDGKVNTVEYLAKAVAFVIFSGSVQHAAVNFPQYDYMSYAPCTPAALWASPPESDQVCNLKTWESMLTPIPTAVEQIQILSVIGTIRHTTLANYRWGEMSGEPEIQKALCSYKQKLAEIDRRIEKRESKEGLPYEFMRPKNIPQSINI